MFVYIYNMVRSFISQFAWTQYGNETDSDLKGSLNGTCEYMTEPGHEKTCRMPYANNSLISTFVVHCLDSIITKFGLSPPPPVFLYWPFQGGTSVVDPYCYLFFLSVFKLWFSYYVSDIFCKVSAAEWPPIWERAVHSVYRECLP